MEKAYEKIVFVNDQAPDLDADNLNSISDAIDTIDDRVVEQDALIDGLDTRVSTNTTNISQNTADITALKNKPSGITLTSASPLTNSTASAIVGIDVDGCSTQDTTKTINCVQGTIANGTVGKAINQSVSSSTIRCISDVVYLTSGSVVAISNSCKYRWYHAESADGNIDSMNSAWQANGETLTASGYYRFLIQGSNASSDVAPSAFTLTASNVSPTPTNPISIVDASGEVVAHNHNLAFKELDGYYISASGVIDSSSYSVMVAKVEQGKTYRAYGMSGTNVFAFYTSEPIVGSVSYNNSRTTQSEGTSDYGIIVAPIDGYVAVRIARNTQYMLTLGTSDMDYVAYASNKITLPTLRSVGTVKDELIVNSDGSGQIVRRVGVLNLKNCTFEYYGEYNNGYLFYYDAIADAKRVDTAILSMCEYFTCVPNSQWSSMSSGQYRVKTDDGRIYANSADKTTKAQFNSWLQGLDHCYLYYVKATPTTTTLTASEVSAIRALKTYNGTTIIDSALEVKSVSYNADTKQYIDDKFAYVSDEVCIGSWMGNPLYRRCFEVVYSGGSTLVIDLGEEITLINLSGAVNEGDRQYSINGGDSTSAWVESDSLVINAMASTNPIRIILEYLKVNDESTISVLSDDSEYYGQIETPDDDVVVGVITEG